MCFAQVASEGRVDLRFLPADDAVRQHMRRIGCNEAFELGSVKCDCLPNASFQLSAVGLERKCLCGHRLLLFTFIQHTAPSCLLCKRTQSIAAKLTARGLRCCRLHKTIAFVLQYLDHRWAAPPGSALVLLAPASQNPIDVGCFWSAAGHPFLTVRARCYAVRSQCRCGQPG